jgi:hypothetical protein
MHTGMPSWNRCRVVPHFSASFLSQDTCRNFLSHSLLQNVPHISQHITLVFSTFLRERWDDEHLILPPSPHWKVLLASSLHSLMRVISNKHSYHRKKRKWERNVFHIQSSCVSWAERS